MSACLHSPTASWFYFNLDLKSLQEPPSASISSSRSCSRRCSRTHLPVSTSFLRSVSVVLNTVHFLRDPLCSTSSVYISFFYSTRWRDLISEMNHGTCSKVVLFSPISKKNEWSASFTLVSPKGYLFWTLENFLLMRECTFVVHV